MKPLTKELRQLLLRQFRSTDHNRESLCHNMKFDMWGQSWIAATEAHALIMIKDQDDIDIQTEVTPPNVPAILPEKFTPIPIDWKGIYQLTDSVPMISRAKEIECDACDGDGKFEHHGEYYDCKTCDETGKIRLSEQETVKDPDYYVRYRELNISMNIWHFVRIALHAIKPEKLELMEQNEKRNIILFRMDEDVIVMIASMWLNETEQKNVKFVDLVFGEEVSNG